MLDRAAAHPSSEVPKTEKEIFALGQYVMYPKQGLSVVTEHKSIAVEGLMMESLEIRALHKPDIAITIPWPKVAKSGLRLLSDAEQLKKALEIATQKSSGNHANWQAREAELIQRMASNELPQVASILRDTLGRSRHKRYNNEKLDAVPKDAPLTYSENVLVQEALSYLAREMALVCGITEKQARTYFITAALQTDFKMDAVQLITTGRAAMPRKKLQEIFGQFKGPGYAIVIAEIPEAVEAKMPRPANRPGATETGNSNIIPAQSRWNKPARARLSSIHAARKVRPEDQLSDEMRAIFIREEKLTAPKGTLRGMFLKAAGSLTPEQFDILSQLALRKNEHQVSIDALAQQREMTRDAVIEIRNTAAAALRRHYPAAPAKIGNYAAISPYKEAGRMATVRPDAEKSLRPEIKAVYAREKAFVSAKGTQHGIFMKAAELLTPEEFEILSKLSIRKKESQLSIDAVAAEVKKPKADIIAVRDGAAEKLLSHFREAGHKVLDFGALQPYKAKGVMVATVRSDLAARIVDGKLLVTVALPLDALKGVENFKVDLTVDKDAQGSPESISGQGKIGKGKGGHFSAASRVVRDRSPS